MTSPLSIETSRVRLLPLDLLGLGLVGVRSRKLRASLSALGISIGIATMILVTAIPATSQAALLTKLTALGTNILRVDPLPTPDGTPAATLPANSVSILRRIGPVLSAAVVADTHAEVRRTDRINISDDSSLTVLATSTGLLATINASIGSGQFISAANQKFPDVVLGHVAASRLGIASIGSGRDQPRIFIGKTWFTVVGILNPVPLSPDIDTSVLVGWSAAKTQLQFDGHPTVVYLKAREDQLSAVRGVVAASLYPQASGLLTVSRPSDVLAAKRDAENNFSALFVGLAAVSLLVGGIGVANTMVISVLERRREIGLRRALGATRSQIAAQFLAEAVILSALGGVAGASIGAAATTAYATSQGWQPVVPITALALGISGALAVGLIAGIYPSLRAARLSPTQALATS